MSEYNLLDEKWILVLDRQGKMQEFSILDVFQQAKEIISLANELPTLDVAILRLLLAIIHSSLAKKVRDYSDGIRIWGELWENGLPFEKISAYLERWRDRFYLFDDRYPFYQVVFAEQPQGITFTYKTANNLNGEISEPDREKPNMFAGRSDRSELSYAEAARWLIHLNSFDIAPAGTPGRAPIRLKGYGLGYLSQIGVLWLKGENLFQTLMLNFVLLDENGNPWVENIPYWETLKALTESQLKSLEILLPTNLAGLYTTQWRRIRLIRNEGYVTGYELWGGCAMKTENAFIEPMTMWKREDNGTYKPLIHDSPKQLWRDFEALSVKDTEHERPRIASWINDIEAEETGIIIPILKFATASIAYKNNTKINDSFSDSLSFNAGMLSNIGAAWVPRICEILSSTDEAVKAVGTLAADLTEAAGDKRDKQGKLSPLMTGKRDSAKTEAYFRLDEPFRSWLADIDPKVDKMDIKLEEWNKITFKILSIIGEELVAQMGTTAFIGVMSLKNGVRTPINSSIAYNRFMSKIYKILKKGEVTTDYEQ